MPSQMAIEILGRSGKQGDKQSLDWLCPRSRTINWALPPDVRRGCAAPSAIRDYGLCPRFGLWPLKMRAKPEPGAQPRSFLFTTTAGQNPASHRAAEPLQVSQKRLFGQSLFDLIFFGRLLVEVRQSASDPLRSRSKTSTAMNTDRGATTDYLVVGGR